MCRLRAETQLRRQPEPVGVADPEQCAVEIPHEAPVAVHCASGYRAGIAASLLEQAGHRRIIHVNGEYSDWDRLHLAESRP